MKNNTWICSLCTDEDGMPREFKNDDEYMAHNKAFHSPDSPKLEKPPQPQVVEDVLVHPPETKVTKAVTLAYVYVGECSDCGKAVDTLEVDVDKKHFCIAWCNACKKQVSLREVVRL